MTYTNEEVYTSFGTAEFYNIQKLFEEFEKYKSHPYLNYVPVGLVFDYVEDAFNPKYEKIVKYGEVYNIEPHFNSYNEIDGDSVVYIRLLKPKEERKDKYDIHSYCVLPFNYISALKLNDIVLQIKLCTEIPIFLAKNQDNIMFQKKGNHDNRII